MDSRRNFFASLLSIGNGKKEDAVFRPLLPGFIVNSVEQCGKCNDSSCKTVCEEGIIIREGDAIPYLDFSRRGCTFCGECSKVCEYDCFIAQPVESIDVRVEINILNCLAWNKTICRTCADVCNEKAIHFTGLWNPEIDMNACSGCGFCIGVCPSNTIQIHPQPKEKI